MKTLLYIFLLSSLCLTVFNVSAQVNVETENKFPVEKKGLRIGLDLTRPAKRFIYNGVREFEILADYNIKKNYFVCFDIGTQQYNFSNNEFSQKQSGQYFRIGGEVNVVPIANDGIFVGLHYGRGSTGLEVNNILINTGYYDTTYIDLPQQTISYSWLELTAGVKTEIYENIFLGWLLRIKFKVSAQDTSPVNTTRLAGYGLVKNNSNLEGNFYIAYLFGVKKKPNDLLNGKLPK